MQVFRPNRCVRLFSGTLHDFSRRMVGRKTKQICYLVGRTSTLGKRGGVPQKADNNHDDTGSDEELHES